MPLVRASCQFSKTIEEFYQDLAASPTSVTSGIGAGMLRVLPGLEELCAHHRVWGLTSHAWLWLLAADDYTSPWLVRVIALGSEYEVSFRMTEAERPWPEALVSGTARDVAAALAMIRIAMERSDGWTFAPVQPTPPPQ
jgi:hypothetical protein